MTEADDRLRGVSDELLALLDRLAAIESEKRTLEPGDDRAVHLAVEARRLSERILATSRAQEDITQWGRQAVTNRPPGATPQAIEGPQRDLELILEEWREAERQAFAADPGAPELGELRRQADGLREEYRRAYELLAGRDLERPGG
jgi:hypothetical protein